jgi:predicted nucleic acid-binding protein
MRWILDSCTLIYLIKAKLFSEFMDLIKFPLVIDSSVYEEAVIKGKVKKYPDAGEVEFALIKFKIPVISIDISQDLNRFNDPGETSCYILAKEDGICLTSDDRAYKKFISEDLKVMKVDTFYFELLNKNHISEDEFFRILKKLEIINATKPKSILFFMEKLKQRKGGIKND